MPVTHETALAAYRSMLSLHKEDSDSFNAGLVAVYLARELGVEKPEESIMDTSIHDDLLIRLGERILDNCYHSDDPRFTAYDLADAIVHWPDEFSMTRMAELSDEDFDVLIHYMAQCKRNTYCMDRIEDNIDLAKEIMAELKP